MKNAKSVIVGVTIIVLFMLLVGLTVGQAQHDAMEEKPVKEHDGIDKEPVKEIDEQHHKQQISDKFESCAETGLGLYESEPKQVLIFATDPGKPIGSVNKERKFDILETKEVKTLFENSVWHRIKIDPDTAGGKPSIGWIYGGKVGGKETIREIWKEK